METNLVPRYELVYRQNPLNKDEKKWFAKAISNGTVDTDTLAKNISIRCTVTRHDAKAVLSAFQEVIGEYLRMGCAVHLEDLGYFRLELQGDGSETASAFTSTLIKNTMLRFRPSHGMKKQVKALTDQWSPNGYAGTEMSQTRLNTEKAQANG